MHFLKKNNGKNIINIHLKKKLSIHNELVFIILQSIKPSDNFRLYIYYQIIHYY